MLGALLKRRVGVLGEGPGEIALAYENQKKATGGWGSRLSDTMQMM